MELFLPMDAYGLEIYTAGECIRDMATFLAVFLLTVTVAAKNLRFPGEADMGAGSGIGWMILVRSMETIIIGALAAVAAAGNRFDNWKCRQEKKLLEQLFEYLDNLRHAYYRTRDVEDAVYEAWGSAGEEWKLHLAVMEERLFSEGLPEIYQQNRPNRFFISFLAICQCASRYGDGEDTESSVFLDNLEELQKNIQMELLQMEKERELYMSVCAGLLVPLICLPLIERWSLAQIPELMSFYQGSTGGLVRILVCLVFGLARHVFRYMKAGRWEQEYRHWSVVEGSGPWQKALVSRLEEWLRVWNRKEGALGRWTGEVYRELKPGGSLMMFYAGRMKAVFVTAVVGIFWCICYRMSLHWFFLWPVVAAAASFLPYLDLILAMDFYRSAREEEVSQFRSVLYMLAGVPQMTAEVVLEWLEQFAWYYREQIAAWADQEGRGVFLPGEDSSGEEQAKDTAGFHRILEDIEASDRVGIREAFRDILSKREFWMARKRQQQELAMKKKEIYIQAVLFLPFGVAVTAYLIVPFLYEGMQSLLSFTEMGV